MSDKLLCKCGKGFASEVDMLCKYCREHKYSRAEAKAAGVRHRGDGMTLDQEDRILKKKGWTR